MLFFCFSENQLLYTMEPVLPIVIQPVGLGADIGHSYSPCSPDVKGESESQEIHEQYCHSSIGCQLKLCQQQIVKYAVCVG